MVFITSRWKDDKGIAADVRLLKFIARDSGSGGKDE